MKTRSRTSFVAVLLPLLAIPALSHADANKAFDACINAFVGASLEKGRPVTVRREEGSVASPVASLNRTYKIQLKAVGKDSGTQLAAATCITDRQGTVLSLSVKPLATPVLADAQSGAR